MLKPSHLHHISTPKLTPLHCGNQLEPKCLCFVTLDTNNGSRQHINRRYKTKVLVLIQPFLCQQMETFSSASFRTSPGDADWLCRDRIMVGSVEQQDSTTPRPPAKPHQVLHAQNPVKISQQVQEHMKCAFPSVSCTAVAMLQPHGTVPCWCGKHDPVFLHRI